MIYDVAIVGGGLAGLALAIQLARQNFGVVLFEKEQYPFHKVCGEYISNESWSFLQGLGLQLHLMDVAQIDTLMVTAPNGTRLKTPLGLGGFGISRYTLDAQLVTLAKSYGVTVLDDCKITSVTFKEDRYELTAQHNRNVSVVQARFCTGSWGKKSNLDKQWQRAFLQKTPAGLNNYVAVKYHVRTTAPLNEIALHNFKGGYCGFSKIEGDKWCLCYMTEARNLRLYGNNIAAMEKAVLHQNPHLKSLFNSVKVCEGFPITISNISFGKKEQDLPQFGPLLGDAAGTIPPLCGNGMSMALHSSKLLARLIPLFFNHTITAEQLASMYAQDWQRTFGIRLKAGRMLQYFFGGNRSTNLLVAGLKPLPGVVCRLIRATHGQPF